MSQKLVYHCAPLERPTLKLFGWQKLPALGGWFFIDWECILNVSFQRCPCVVLFIMFPLLSLYLKVWLLSATWGAFAKRQLIYFENETTDQLDNEHCLLSIIPGKAALCILATQDVFITVEKMLTLHQVKQESCCIYFAALLHWRGEEI